MRKTLLFAILMLICTSSFGQNYYDNKKTPTGEIYRAVYHKLGVDFPSSGILNASIFHIIREVIDDGQSSFYYELFFSSEGEERAVLTAEDLKNIIPALEQIYQDYQKDKGGVSMYFAKNGFSVGYDTELRQNWKIVLPKGNGLPKTYTSMKADKIPEIISVFKQALSKIEELSK